jgi:hypothetical protein
MVIPHIESAMPAEEAYQELEVEEEDNELEIASLVESNYAPLTLFSFQPEEFGLGSGITINEPPNPPAEDLSTEDRSSTVGTDAPPIHSFYGPLQLQPAFQTTEGTPPPISAPAEQIGRAHV